MLTPDDNEEPGRPETVRCDFVVPDADFAVALQPLGRAGRISGARSAVVHAVSSAGIEDGIPDGTTLWLFREKLAQAGIIERLFDRFDQHLEAGGYIARGGQIVDASIVQVPRTTNTREENGAIKTGSRPRIGRRNRPRTGRRIRMHAGRRSTATASSATRTT